MRVSRPEKRDHSENAIADKFCQLGPNFDFRVDIKSLEISMNRPVTQSVKKESINQLVKSGIKAHKRTIKTRNQMCTYKMTIHIFP